MSFEFQTVQPVKADKSKRTVTKMTKKKRKPNKYILATMKARRTNAKSFHYKGNLYVRQKNPQPHLADIFVKK